MDFSEAMYASQLDSTFWATDDSVGIPPGVFIWDNPTTLRFLADTTWADPPWLQGHTYTLRADGTRLRDRAGNPLADPSVEVSFTTLREEDMGTFSGILYDDKTEAQGAFHLFATQIASPRSRAVTYHWTVPDTGAYTSVAMLPEDYVISAFRDEDHNGKWSAGTPLPFIPAERRITYADTVTIRARWDTANINLRFSK